MNIEVERKILVGAYVDLDVVEYNGKLVFETQFIHYDAELDTRKEDYKDELWGDFAEFDNSYGNFCSVRIFHLSYGEKINLQAGDKIRTVIQSFYIGKEKTKDGRRKLHITVGNARRVYHWTRFCLAQRGIVLTLWCGSRRAREREFLLTVRRGIQSDNGRVRPVIAEVLPNGSILRVSPDIRRSSAMTTGDYHLQERQRGRTMKDIESDFLPIPPYDRIIPTRERRYLNRTYA